MSSSSSSSSSSLSSLGWVLWLDPGSVRLQQRQPGQLQRRRRLGLHISRHAAVRLAVRCVAALRKHTCLQGCTLICAPYLTTFACILPA